jgi:magnesium transporter
MEHPTQSLQERIADIHRLLEKFRVESHLVTASFQRKPDLERVLVERQQTAELERHLAKFHAADLAELLESLSADDRQHVWARLAPQRRGEVLLELSNAVLTSLVESMSHVELVAALQYLDADDLAYLSDAIPGRAFHETVNALNSEDRSWVRDTAAYTADSVGHLMFSESLIVHPTQTLASIQALLRDQKELSLNTEKLFVADSRGHLCGTLFLQDILLNAPESSVADVMQENVVAFRPDDDLNDAARAFERYDLISAPVVNERGKIIGRLTVDSVMDYVREASEMDALNVVGVVGTEDLFSTVWSSARNRWLWLCINLGTAFVVSRIIGNFEGTITKMVALASLMPIITSMAGNTGNQTAALVIRRLALDQISRGNLRQLWRKELGISLLNGVVWGGAVGLFAYVFYQQFALALVAALAMMLGFQLAAVVGIGAPLLLDRLGRDPAMGSSVILTGLTDALGFLVFLALASIFLV